MIDAVLRGRRWILAVVLTLTVLAPLALLRLEVDTDPENMLAADDPARVRTHALADTFGLGRHLAVALVSEDPLDDAELAAVLDLQREAADLPGVAGQGPLGPGSVLDPGVDPTVLGPAELAALRTRVAEHEVLSGQALSEAGTTAAVLLPLTDDADALALAEDVRETVAAEDRLDDTRLALSGVPLAQEAFGQQMFVQMALFAPLAAVVVMGLLWWFFRRLRPLVATMALALVTVLWTMAILVGTGHSVHIMSSMIPIFLMPIAILDAVHVLSEYTERLRRGGSREEVTRATYAPLAKPIAFTSVTTAIGFASLALTPIPPVQTFGVFVAVGVLLAWLLTLVLLPGLLLGMSPRGGARASTSWTGRGVYAAGAAAVRHRRSVLLVSAALAVFALAGVARIEVNDDPVEWFRAEAPERQDAELVERELSGTTPLHLVIRGRPGELAEPAVAAAVSRLDERLSAAAGVGSVASYPSADPRDPLTRTLITPDRSSANVWLRLTDGDNRTVSGAVDAAERSLEQVDLPSDLTVSLAGQGFVNLTWQDQMVSGMTRSFAVALALLAVVVSILFRSVRWGLVAMVPVLWTVAVVYGAIGWLGIDFDMPLAVLTTLALGIGVDFAIHFVSRYRELAQRTGPGWPAVSTFLGEPARALTRNALIIAVGFLPLVLSGLVPYVVVGVLLLLIMGLSWGSTVTILPALVSRPRAEDPALDPDVDWLDRARPSDDATGGQGGQEGLRAEV